MRYIHRVNSASGGWETWGWDESLFAGTAGYYGQGRLPYAPGLADVFARSLALGGQGRLLDVGCGPGTVTLRLAPLFEAVVSLDPDAEMLARASRAAAERGVGNATWVRQRAEAVPGRPGQLPGRDLRRVVSLDGPAPRGLGRRDDARSGWSGGAGRRAWLPDRRAVSGDPARHASVPAAARRRPRSLGVSTWAATGGPGAAFATRRPTVRTRCSRRPASCRLRR